MYIQVKALIRGCAFALSIIFALEQISFSASTLPEALKRLSTKHEASGILDNPYSLDIPFQYVSLKEVFKGTSNKLIIHIQDAHSNLSGQQSLASALDHLMAQHDIPLVLVEGASKDVTLDEVKKIIAPERMKLAAKRFLMDGLISGEEYLNLTSGHPMKIMGIEDKTLNNQSLVAYADLREKREGALAYIDQIQSALERLKGKLYPKELLEFERKNGANLDSRLRGNDNTGRNDSAGRYEELLRLADQAKIKTIGNYSEITKLRFLKETEKSIDFKKANEEQTKLLEALSQKGASQKVQDLIRSSKKTKNSQLSQYMLIESILRMAAEAKILRYAQDDEDEISQDNGKGEYFELLKYHDYLKGFSQIRFDLLIEELEALEAEVYRHMLPKEDALKVYAIQRYVSLLKKAYQIQLTSREFETLLANEEKFKTASFEAFMNEKILQQNQADYLVPYKNILEEGQPFIKNFYELVEKRDLAFVENSDRIMTEYKKNVAFLITGGYHTDHLTELLRKRDISYVVLTPMVTSETNQEKYEKLLMAPLKLAPQEYMKARTVQSKTKSPLEPKLTTRRLEALLESGSAGISRWQSLYSKGNPLSPEESQRLQGLLRKEAKGPFEGPPDVTSPSDIKAPLPPKEQKPGRPIVMGARMAEKSTINHTSDAPEAFNTVQHLMTINNVSRAFLSPAGDTIIVLEGTREEGFVGKVYDNGGREVFQFPVPTHSDAGDFSPDGRYFRIHNYAEKSTTFLDLKDAEALRKIEVPYRVAYFLNAKWIFCKSVDNDKPNKLLNLETGEDLESLIGSDVFDVQFSSDGRFLFVRYSSKKGWQEKLYNLETKEDLGHLIGANVEDITFFPDGKKVAVLSDDEPRIFDLETKKGLPFSFDPDDHSLQISPDGRWVAAYRPLSNKGLITVIDMSGVYPKKEITIDRRLSRNSFSPDGRHLFVSGTPDVSNKLFNVETGEDLEALIGSDVREVKFAPDGKRALIKYRERTPKVFDLELKGELQYFDLPEGGWLDDVEFSANGRWAIVSYDDPTKGITRKIYDLEQRRRVALLDDDRFYMPHFSPNGTHIVFGHPFGGLFGAILFDLRDGQNLNALIGPGVVRVEFSRDGKRAIFFYQNNFVKSLDLEVLNAPFFKGIIEKWGDKSYLVIEALSGLIRQGIIRSEQDFLDWHSSFFQFHGPVEETVTNINNFLRHTFSGQKLTEVISRYNELYDNGIAPLPHLLVSDLSPNVLRQELNEIQNGRFRIEDPIHADLNFHLLNPEIKISGAANRIDYADFVSLLGDVRRGVSPLDHSAQVDEAIKMQIRGLAYEAYLMRQKILSIQEQAKKLGRKVVVVENLSYGAVATSPITYERDGQKYIYGTDIPVWSAKVGSTEAHNNEFVLNPDLLTEEQMRFLQENSPIVVVVDASTSVADPQRTSPHIPDAFKGYRNYFIALNASLGLENRPEDFLVDREFIDGIRQDSTFQRIIEHLGNVSSQGPPYKFYFYYPGNRPLYLRSQKKADQVAPKLENVAVLKGPAVVFLQSAMEPEAVPTSIQGGFIKGQHAPAYFDDKDHYKQFYLNYEPGYGIQLSRKYVSESRKTYGELLSYLGERPVGVEVISPKLDETAYREIDTIVLDLDGTIAATDRPLSERAVAVLRDLLLQGKKVVIATEDVENKVDGRLRGLVDTLLDTNPQALKNLWLATDGATKLFQYTENRQKIENSSYNTRTLIEPAEREQILGILERNFAGLYSLDQRPGRVNPERRVDLRNIRDSDRKRIITEMRAFLRQSNLDYQVYKAGKSSIKIVKRHKADLLSYLKRSKGLVEQRTLIIADSAGVDQIDRELLSRFREAVSVNVGRRSSNIGNINPEIFQTGLGVDGALDLLEGLSRNAILPMRGLLPYKAAYQVRPAPYLMNVGARLAERSKVVVVRGAEEFSIGGGFPAPASSAALVTPKEMALLSRIDSNHLKNQPIALALPTANGELVVFGEPHGSGLVSVWGANNIRELFATEFNSPRQNALFQALMKFEQDFADVVDPNTPVVTRLSIASLIRGKTYEDALAYLGTIATAVEVQRKRGPNFFQFVDYKEHQKLLDELLAQHRIELKSDDTFPANAIQREVRNINEGVESIVSGAGVTFFDMQEGDYFLDIMSTLIVDGIIARLPEKAKVGDEVINRLQDILRRLTNNPELTLTQEDLDALKDFKVAKLDFYRRVALKAVRAILADYIKQYKLMVESTAWTA